MNAIWVIAAVAAPVCVGWLVVRAIWPPESLWRGVVLRVSLAVAVGFAIAAIHYFAWRAVSSAAPGIAFKLADCFILPALAFLAARRLGKSSAVTLAPTPAVSFRWMSWQGAMLVTTLAIVAAALVTMAGRAWYEAYGYWDAWAIWNLKARFMFCGGPEWSAFFSRHAWYAHPDYPLLLPASVARLWTYLGDDPAVVPQLLSVGFSSLLLAIVFGVVATLRGVPAACLATIVIAGAERVLFYGGSQMADIVLAAYVAGGAGLILIAGRAEHGGRRVLLLAGLFIGFATFVKNEGLMLALCVIVALAIAALCSCDARVASRRRRILHEATQASQLPRGAESVRRPALVVFVGMLPGLVTFAAQRIAFPADTYMLEDQESTLREKATDAARHATIVGFIARTDLGVSQRIVGPFDGTLPNKPLLWLLILLPVVGGLAIPQRDRFAAIACGTWLTLGFAGYYAALLVMPYDLQGNLEYGFDRCQLHIYPILVMTIMVITRRLPASLSSS